MPNAEDSRYNIGRHTGTAELFCFTGDEITGKNRNNKRINKITFFRFHASYFLIRSRFKHRTNVYVLERL